MKKTLALGLALVGLSATAHTQVSPPDSRPTCERCQGTYISVGELDRYRLKALAERLVDQQVRAVDIGKAHVAVGIVHRGRLLEPGPLSVAEHDQVSEVYHVISGSGTLVLGPDIVGGQRRSVDTPAVVDKNGPGHSGSSIDHGVTYELKAGDVVIIPAGTGHWFTRIDDHIDYLMVRVDPDKVTRLKDASQSERYLSSPTIKKP